MFLRFFLLLFLFTYLPNQLFPFGRSDKSSISNINLVELKDKDYRTLAVMPFNNLTDQDHYAYLGKTIQRFVTENLLILDKIEVTTNDFFIPEKHFTNKSILFSYGSNFSRNMIIINADEIYKKFLVFPEVDNLAEFAKYCNCDYLVHGSYKFLKFNKEQFIIQYKIYNKVQQKDVYQSEVIFNARMIEDEVKKISDDILMFFKNKRTGSLELVTIYSNLEILIDNVIVDNSLSQYKLPEGGHSLQLKLLKKVLSTNINIISGQTNILYFTNEIFNTGILKVDAAPVDAQVFLNVSYLGNTPLLVTNIKTGSYRLQVERSNYQTCFQDISIKEGTNYYSVKLDRARTPLEREAQYRRDKTIMYLSLGLGTSSMLLAYYCIAQSDLEEERYNLYRKRENMEKRDEYLTYSFISLLCGLTSLTVSFVYFVKVISYDDVNIGMLDQPNIDLVYRNNNNYLFWHCRF